MLFLLILLTEGICFGCWVEGTKDKEMAAVTAEMLIVNDLNKYKK